MDCFTAESKIGEIVAQRCSLSRVFENYQIDYCCGGKKTLGEACQKKGIDPQVVLNDIKRQLTETTDEKNWTQKSLSDLIDHIQTTYHSYLVEELPKLTQLVEKVARVHGDKHPELLEIRDIYSKLQAELMVHMGKEDDLVFPAIKKIEAAQTEGTQLKQPILELEQEHDAAGNALHKLRSLTRNYTPPENACNSYLALFSRLEELETSMHHHVHKENSILFPRALAMQTNLQR
ncbi:MAG: Iron-sulfur cluster repair protein YtfE [Chlamydiae bacterium]|nr:Iron-sulfur cluster repair protein YtfE [Chlamydiota bacterium]